MASLLNSTTSAMNTAPHPGARDKERRKEQMAALTPRRVAIKLAPPTLILEYVAPSDFGARYLHYKVRLGHLRPSMDPASVTNRVYRKHPRFFDRAKVEFGQVLKLVTRLVDHAGVAASSPVAAPPAPPPARAEVDLNKVSDFRLRAAKLEMDVGFEKTLKRPGEEGYEYDKEVEFDAPESEGSWDD